MQRMPLKAKPARSRRWLSWLAMLLGFLGATSAAGQTTRIKDIVNVRGFRTNQLIGFGLVVGLKGTGDSQKSLATNRAIANLLTRLGMQTSAEEAVSGNVAAVVATADLAAFSRIGDRIDVRISTVGDAKSLAGGTLLLTPLHAGDNQVYVVAQGSVVVGQASGSGVQVLTVARVPGGGSVEREFSPLLDPGGKMTLSLKDPDFATNAHVADAINAHFKGFFAHSLDPATIEVTVPQLFRSRLVEFVAELEDLSVAVDHQAIVVLNERTGTVVMGSDVTIGRVTITHGDLAIQVGGNGPNKKPPRSVVSFDGATVGALVETMNALGMKPADLVGILQAIHAAGALQAELKFI